MEDLFRKSLGSSNQENSESDTLVNRHTLIMNRRFGKEDEQERTKTRDRVDRVERGRGRLSEGETAVKHGGKSKKEGDGHRTNFVFQNFHEQNAGWATRGKNRNRRDLSAEIRQNIHYRLNGRHFENQKQSRRNSRKVVHLRRRNSATNRKMNYSMKASRNLKPRNKIRFEMEREEFSFGQGQKTSDLFKMNVLKNSKKSSDLQESLNNLKELDLGFSKVGLFDNLEKNRRFSREDPHLLKCGTKRTSKSVNIQIKKEKCGTKCKEKLEIFRKYISDLNPEYAFKPGQLLKVFDKVFRN